ncbi:hypothetical protein C9993_11580 [Marinobacter sp. Z-F4-2]|jgi:hypothetical protein|nr:hypothetical protein [Hahellaceae bacterium]PTB92042.1 hypothetical protein C9993_11580 [Marinobacter sp. Z-F4-2]|tara:strand:+ start:4989 stop:5294 length:306 start_codon:yes stop_codon:yes gene_type:complete
MIILKTRLDMPEANVRNVRKEAGKKMHCYVPEKLQARYAFECTNSMAYKRAASKEEGDAYCACYAEETTSQLMALEPGYHYDNKFMRNSALGKRAHKKCRP